MIDYFANEVLEDFLYLFDDAWVGLLWVNIAQETQNEDCSFDDHVWLWIFEKWAIFDQSFCWVIDVCSEIVEVEWLFSAILAQSHVQWLDAEIAYEGNWAINVVAKCLNQLRSLSFENLGLLLITSVKSQIYEFLWIFVHFLSLTFCGLYKVEPNVKN